MYVVLDRELFKTTNAIKAIKAIKSIKAVKAIFYIKARLVNIKGGNPIRTRLKVLLSLKSPTLNLAKHALRNDKSSCRCSTGSTSCRCSAYIL